MPFPLSGLGVLFVLTTALAACNPGSPGGGNPGGPTGGARPVTFTVTVDPKAFSNKRQITVAIWDADQLKIAEETGGCSVSKDLQTGRETVSCPPGVIYRASTPEETIVSRDELARGLTIPSRFVTVGERYRVSMSGMAFDDCNTASAAQEGVAGSEAINLANLQVAQTEMDCQPTRGQ